MHSRGVNGNAIAFIKVINQGLKQRNPGCILAAEDSTNYLNVTKSIDQGGLGSDYKCAHISGLDGFMSVFSVPVSGPEQTGRSGQSLSLVK